MKVWRQCSHDETSVGFPKPHDDEGGDGDISSSTLHRVFSMGQVLF